MKKILAGVLAVVLAGALSGCSAVSRVIDELRENTVTSATAGYSGPTVQSRPAVQSTPTASVQSSIAGKSESVASVPGESSSIGEISTPVHSSVGETSSNNNILGNIIRPEVKEAIDSYEAFIDEYCDFMKKMSSTDNTLTIMMEYMEYMQKLVNMEEKMDKIKGDLTDAETAYYTTVTLRCLQKMASVAE